MSTCPLPSQSQPCVYTLRHKLQHAVIFIVLSLVLIAASLPVLAEVSVEDDLKNTITLEQPAQRIISLAPSVTELLFSAGAGSKVVAVVDYSDFPEAAKELPHVGGYTQLDIERILALQPDLVIGWKSGNHPDTLEKLRQLGLPVYTTETRYLEQIPVTLEKFGRLAGTSTIAKKEAEHFRLTLQKLKDQYQHKAPVKVFYQVWNKPLITINKENLINQVINVCGGQNVFAELSNIAPRIDIEAVLKVNPDAIVASGMRVERPEWLDEWKDWPAINAVQKRQLHFIPPGHIQRQTVRVLLGAEQLCQQLDQTRHRIATSSTGNNQ